MIHVFIKRFDKCHSNRTEFELLPCQAYWWSPFHLRMRNAVMKFDIIITSGVQFLIMGFNYIHG